MSSRKLWGIEIQIEYTFPKPTTLSEIPNVAHETIFEK